MNRIASLPSALSKLVELDALHLHKLDPLSEHRLTAVITRWETVEFTLSAGFSGNGIPARHYTDAPRKESDRSARLCERLPVIGPAVGYFYIQLKSREIAAIEVEIIVRV
jgi:hypothetical protein